jgi:hypothetical protein
MGYLPPARGLCGVMRLTPTWLVMLGGQGPTKYAHHDIQRLHLPTLSWRPPVHVSGGSSNNSKARDSGPAAHAGALGLCADGSSCASVGCSAEACVVLGGVQEGAYGARIVPRLQILLPGPVIAASQTTQCSSASAGVSTGCASGSTTLWHSALYMQQTLPQEQAAWHAFATTCCRCGSCCSCLAARAAASGAGQGAGCGSTAAAVVSDLQHHRAGQQHSGPQDAASQHGSVPRWQAVNGFQRDANLEGVGAAHSSSSGCSKGVSAGQGLSGWSGEIEIEPAMAMQQSAHPLAALVRGHFGLGNPRFAFPGSWQVRRGVEADAGGVRVWQTSSRSSGGGGSQLLLALFVMAVGLVLMAPSLMMHQ